VLLAGAEKEVLYERRLTGEEHCAAATAPGMKNTPDPKRPRKNNAMFLHAGEEFFSVGKYLVIGAFLTSIFQRRYPRAQWLAYQAAASCRFS
jgi:uncharacterized membrane protein YraQ (UPF0718 family)